MDAPRPDVQTIPVLAPDLVDDTGPRLSTLRALTTLSRGNGVLVRASDEEGLLDQMCRTIVDAGGYRFAWYGRPEDDAARTVRPVAVAGAHDGYLDEISISWGDGPLGEGPTGRALRLGTTQMVEDFAAEASYAPWLTATSSRGFRCSVSMPVVVDGAIDGVLVVYADEAHAFDPLALGLLEDLAADVGYGLARLRDAERLSEALHSSIFLLSAAVEARDPYTAGHQSQVATLSEAIGRTLGLADTVLEGLSLGASIHDLGKIAVPRETLEREGTLSEHEWTMLRQHPLTGYEIAGRFPWPWPIAAMIHQHHERMDGSGYPNGLRGKEILLEARVIAVADTFDAIGHDRPYRQAPGYARAIEVITDGRGTLFDVDVVDAFLAVMADGFRMPASASAAP